MSKNTRWSEDDLRKKGLVQNEAGDYVPVSSLVNKGKVEKIVPPKPVKISQVVKDYLNDPERQTKDMELAHGFALMIQNQMRAGVDPVAVINQPVLTKVVNDKLVQELLDVAKFYNCKILTEKRTIKIKPLTQNRAWKGRRFKSDQYKVYATAVDLLLPNDLVVPDGLLKVYYEFGMSVNSDFDNPCKMFTDILQKKYGFNDSRIMEAKIRKVIVKKGEEYISFKIESL